LADLEGVGPVIEELQVREALQLRSPGDLLLGGVER
jgi:hypothetical protein